MKKKQWEKGKKGQKKKRGTSNTFVNVRLALSLSFSLCHLPSA